MNHSARRLSAVSLLLLLISGFSARAEDQPMARAALPPPLPASPPEAQSVPLAAGSKTSGGRRCSGRRPETSGRPSRTDFVQQAEACCGGGSHCLVVHEKSGKEWSPGTATLSARTNRPWPAGGRRYALSRPTAAALQVLSRLSARVRSVSPCVPIPLATGSLAAAVRVASLPTSPGHGRAVAAADLT